MGYQHRLVCYCLTSWLKITGRGRNLNLFVIKEFRKSPNWRNLEKLTIVNDVEWIVKCRHLCVKNRAVSIITAVEIEASVTSQRCRHTHIATAVRVVRLGRFSQTSTFVYNCSLSRVLSLSQFGMAARKKNKWKREKIQLLNGGLKCVSVCECV